MRNFEERKTEVFNRYEKRIKEREIKRNRILSVCIPLCLVCVVLTSVMFAPAFQKWIYTFAKPNEEYFFTDEDFLTSGDFFYSDDDSLNNDDYESVEVKQNDKTLKVYSSKDDSEKMASISEGFSELLYSDASDVGSLADSASPNTSIKEESNSLSDNTDDYKATEYTVIFVDGEGKRSEYELLDKKIINKTDKTEKILTDIEYAKLMELLGIDEMYMED